MRYVQLRAFHHVAVCGGFSRAANALCLTQPAISDQVRKLEEEYDVLLFNRHKRQVSLTGAGHRLLQVTRKLFESERQASELLLESRALRSGRLRVIADSAHHLLQALSRFRAAYPALDVEVRSGNSEQVVAALFAYEADVGVLGEVPQGREFQTVRLGASPLIAFAAHEHPLAGRPGIAMAELCGFPLVLREPGSRTRRDFEAAARKLGLPLRAAVEAEGREAVRELVANGAGVGIVSAAEFGCDSRLVPVPITDCRIMMEEALVCLADRARGKLVRAFLDLATDTASAVPVPAHA